MFRVCGTGVCDPACLVCMHRFFPGFFLKDYGFGWVDYAVGRFRRAAVLIESVRSEHFIVLRTILFGG